MGLKVAIIAWPDDVEAVPEIICAICGESRPADAVSAGMETFSGHPAFACDAHFGIASSYIVGWVDFVAAVRSDAGDFPDAHEFTEAE